MARRVYVHIGLPKTGTTFLQTTMWHNRRLMREHGLLYPGSSRMDHYHASQAIRGASGRVPAAGPAWRRLQEELAAWDGDGIITHEFLSIASLKEARAMVRALAPAEVHVVVTVRDYVRQFPAVWQEWLKMPGEESLDDFMQLAFDRQVKGAWSWRSQDAPAILARWQKAVPADRIQVVTVPPPGAPRPLLWQRWCRAVGLDDTGFDHDVSFPNESLGGPQAALMLDLKPYLTGDLTAGPVRHRWVRKYLAHEVLVAQDGPKFGPRPDHAARLAALSADAATELRRRGYAVIGDLDDLVPPADAPALRNPGDVSDAEKLEVALRAIDTLVHDVRSLTKQLGAAPAPRTPGNRGRRAVRRSRTAARSLARRAARRVRTR